MYCILSYLRCLVYYFFIGTFKRRRRESMLDRIFGIIVFLALCAFVLFVLYVLVIT